MNNSDAGPWGELTGFGGANVSHMHLLRPHAPPLSLPASHWCYQIQLKPSNYTCLGKCGEFWGRDRPGRNRDPGRAERMRGGGGRRQISASHTHTHTHTLLVLM